MIGSGRKRLLIALLFLLPNLAGFLLFTAGPVVFSLYLSFTDTSLTEHNRYSDASPRWVGLDNYARLLWGDESVFFWDYFWNTVFLMIGIPLSIFGSLALALLLNSKATPAKPKSRWLLSGVAAAFTLIACFGTWVLAAPDEAARAVMSTETGLTDLTVYEVQTLRRNGLTLFVGLVGVVVTAGLGIGQMFFRAAFYLPTLLAGVAMFLLWKTLYRPRGGLINAVLDPILGAVETMVEATPAWLWYGLGIATAALGVFLSVRLTVTGVGRLRHGDVGPAAFGTRVMLTLTLLASMVGLGVVLAQLPAKALLPSGYLPLTPEQSDRALASFEGELGGEYDELEFTAVRSNFERGPAFEDLVARLASIKSEEATARVQRHVAETTRRAAEEGVLSREEAVASVEAFIAEFDVASAPASQLRELVADPDRTPQLRVLVDAMSVALVRTFGERIADVLDPLAPADGAAFTKAGAGRAIDAVAEAFAGEFEPAAIEAVRRELTTVAYRDAYSQLVSIAGEDNEAAVAAILTETASRDRAGLTAGAGLEPPEWLISSRWAKTALIIMGVWLGIGGGNMLLYLAGLSNIAPELYEAAAIDGATGWQRFIHVTWPQLAPTTFFIVIMSTIGGLQGGFEQALVMTQGKADTIVLTYYLYNLAFNGNFQLGLASAVAWIMFAIIFAMTAFNFRFGSRMTNE